MTSSSGTEAAAREILAQLAGAVGGGERTVAAYYLRASDRMRNTLGGPLDFGRAFGNDRYSPILDGLSAELTSLELVGESARGTIAVTTAGGAATFVLAVAKAKFGERQGEWCLSGVAREGADL